MNNTTNSPQLGFLQEYEYSETLVLAGISPLGEMIAIRPICENLGIDRKWQQDKIKSDPYLSSTGGMVKVIAQDGKSREMYCLPPLAIQEWLYNLTASENMNVEVLNEYKKGLVVHLLMMLKVSLDEIQRLRSIEKKYQSLKSKVGMMMSIEEQAAEARIISRERSYEKKMISKSVQESLFENVNQLSIED